MCMVLTCYMSCLTVTYVLWNSHVTMQHVDHAVHAAGAIIWFIAVAFPFVSSWAPHGSQ